MDGEDLQVDSFGTITLVASLPKPEFGTPVYRLLF